MVSLLFLNNVSFLSTFDVKIKHDQNIVDINLTI